MACTRSAAGGGGLGAAGGKRPAGGAQPAARCRSARSQAGLCGARGARAHRSGHGRGQRDFLSGGAAEGRGGRDRSRPRSCRRSALPRPPDVHCADAILARHAGGRRRAAASAVPSSIALLGERSVLESGAAAVHRGRAVPGRRSGAGVRRATARRAGRTPAGALYPHCRRRRRARNRCSTDWWRWRLARPRRTGCWCTMRRVPA